MSKKAVFKLDICFGREGDLDGIFIATQEQVDTLVDEEIEVYFGEVLGKHSEVYKAIEPDEIEFVSDEKKVVDLIESYGLTSGLSPFDYRAINFDYGDHGIEEGDDYDDDDIESLVNKIIEKNKNNNN